MSPAFDWQALLGEWSRLLLSTELAAVFPEQAHQAGWVGYAGASEGEIVRLEDRLKVPLPPSYRQFLQVSDGWPLVLPFLGRIWPARQVEWLAVRSPSLIEDWRLGEQLAGPPQPIPDELYFVYGQAQDPASMRSEYLPQALQISDLDPQDGAVYLLNPQVMTPQGEWEAWFLAPWLPGAVRCRSFWELMQGEFRRCQEAVESATAWTPELLAYARQRLYPAEPEALASRLPELVARLDQLAGEHLQRIQPQPGKPPPGQRPTLPSYQRGMAEAFQQAADRIREIQAQAAGEQELRSRLQVLADELERLGRAGMKKSLKEFNRPGSLAAGALDYLSGSVEGFDRQLGSSGLPAGLRTAAEMIQTFLHTGQ